MEINYINNRNTTKTFKVIAKSKVYTLHAHYLITP